SVLVAASEQRLVLIDAVMIEIDRQVNDLLEVKIYKLQNADPTQMTTILTTLFQPQIKATQGSGQGQSGGGRGGAANNQGMTIAGGRQNQTGSGANNTLLPSQEVEIAADVRTHSVIVKASKAYIQFVDE